MGVTVYPRLGELLAERHLSVSALGRQIEERFGLAVNPKSLYRLTQATAVQRADLAIAGATAAILGVSLADLFRVEVTPAALGTPPDDDLTPLENARLGELFDRRAHAGLTTTEDAELAALVVAYGRHLHERQVRAYAAAQGLSIDAARDRLATDLDEALTWWRAVEASPARRRALTEQARRRRIATSG